MAQHDPEIHELIAAGRKIEAIRLYRERYGVGLKEAKDAVDALERGERPDSSRGQPPRSLADDPAFAPVIDSLLRDGQKIQAIKQYRERYPVGLKEAKDRVDARERELGIAPQSRCLIATAAYGSAIAPEVQILRRYRDVVLTRSLLGRTLIAGYYRVSPMIAAPLSSSARGQRCVRRLLHPLVRYCRRQLDRVPPPRCDEEPTQGT